MHATAAVSLLLVCFAARCSAAGQPFSYSNQSAWPSLPGSHCGLSRQSPIDIVVRDTTTRADLTKLQLGGWDQSVSGMMENTGATLKFTPATTTTLRTTTVNHRGTYRLAQFHLHWGNMAGMGSEHLLNGDSYDAELHYVHSRTQPPSNGTEGDAFAVVGVFLRSDSAPLVTGSPWERLFNMIPDASQSVDISGVIYNDFLPTNLSYFYYEGSLTTPPCNEVVQWFVLQNPVPIPEAVLRRLRAAPAGVINTTQTMNFRQVQPLNGRQVLRYNSASTIAPVISVLIMTVLALAISLG